MPVGELLPLMKCPTGKYGCLDPKGVDPRIVGYCVTENTNEACIPLTDVPTTAATPRWQADSGRWDTYCPPVS